MWGFNLYGQVGDNTRSPGYSSPVQIPGTTWAAITLHTTRSMATKTDGTLWSWGYQYRGTLGHNQGGAIRISSPTQIPGTTWSTSFRKMALTNTTSAIKTDGTMWLWGENDHGQFANNTAGTPTNRSSPVQLPGTTWRSLCHIQDGVLASKTDGTLWAWGRGAEQNGQLRQNSQISYSSPVQIPGTTWSGVVGGGMYHGVATKTDGTLWGLSLIHISEPTRPY